jgi:inositol transport system substrate-binding protein
LAEVKGNYQIIGEMSGNWSRAEAQMLTEGQLTVLASPPDVIVADNDDMAMGALEAIRLSGRDPAAIKVVGFDALPFALEQVRNGTLAATVDQKPGAQIRTALRMVADNLRNHAPLHSATIDTVLITRGNVEVAENAPETN